MVNNLNFVSYFAVGFCTRFSFHQSCILVQAYKILELFGESGQRDKISVLILYISRSGIVRALTAAQ